MKSLSRALLWTLALAAVLLAVVFASRSPVTKFNGKSAYDWMLETTSSDLANNPGLSAIGSNAVPYIARALATQNTPYDRFAFLRKPQIHSLLAKLGFPAGFTRSSQEIRRAATFSLLAFSFEARPALPQLHAELVSSNAANRQGVIFCLSELGPVPESIPFLVQAWSLSTNEVWVVRHTLLHTLGRGGTNAAALASHIALSALDDPETNICAAAALALDRWGQPVPAAVPKLVSMLSSSLSDLAVKDF